MPIDTDAEESDVVLLDTSAAIPFIVKDHDDHDVTRAHVHGKRLGLAGHAWFESFAYLTRLSAGRRRSPADAARILAQNFPASQFLSEAAAHQLTTDLARLTISGGAVYDALVAAVARERGLTLVSRDARAQPTYEALGVVSEGIR